MAEIAVVGSGIGGLCAAIAVAARDVPVRVYEMAEGPGGKAAAIEHDGVEIDIGPHVLTLPDALDRVFRLAGSTLADELEVFQPDPFFDYEWPDGTRLRIHPDPSRTLEEVETVFGAEAEAELREFLEHSRRLWGAAAPRAGHAPEAGAPSRLGQLMEGVRRLVMGDRLRTARGAIHSRVAEPHLREILTRIVTYTGSDPRRAPAALNSLAHVELGLGGFGVKGGMYQIVRALMRAAGDLGVAFEFGTRISRLRERGGVVDGIETRDGRKISVPAVVVNCDATFLYERLLSRRSEQIPSDRSMSAWTAVLRARRRTGAQRRTAHAVLFPGGSFMKEFEEVFDAGRPPSDPAIYLCAQEVAHGAEGWEDDEPLFVMTSAPPEPVDGSNPEWYDELRERVLARLRGAGWIDAADEIIFEQTPRDFAERYPGSQGALYGPAIHSRAALSHRLPNRVPSVRGLYAASASAEPGAGVSLCAASGLAAAEALLEDLDLALPLTAR